MLLKINVFFLMINYANMMSTVRGSWGMKILRGTKFGKLENPEKTCDPQSQKPQF